MSADTAPDSLERSVLAAWDRAAASSLAAELPRQLTDLLLPLFPEAAPEALELTRHGRYEELYLLDHHAPLLWRTARAAFVTRMREAPGLIRAVPTLADLVDQIPADEHDERDELRALVEAVFPEPSDTHERIGALFAWSRHEPPERADAMITEALGLMAETDANHLNGYVHRFPRAFSARIPELRALCEPHLAGPKAPEILAARAKFGDEAARHADTERALALIEDPERLAFVLYTLNEHAPFAWLDAAIARCIAQLPTRRNLLFFAGEFAPHVPERLLDAMLAKAADLRAERWALAVLLARVAPHHASRGDALRSSLETLLIPIVEGGPASWDFPDGVEPALFRVQIVADAAGALHGEARRRAQEGGLRILEATPTDRSLESAIDRIDWEALGRGLDPSLRAEAVRVVSSIHHRPSALAAIGRMVGAFPREAQHLGLAVLSRLGERQAAGGLPEARAALVAAAEGARPVRKRTARRVGATQDLETLLDGVILDLAALELACAKLSLEEAQALRARIESLRFGNAQTVALLALATAPVLAASPERAAVVADALRLWSTDRGPEREVPGALALHILEIAAPGDAEWRERLAEALDRKRLDDAGLLALLTAFAPVIAHLGGEALVHAVVERLDAPLPVPRFARPWAGAGTRLALA